MTPRQLASLVREAASSIQAIDLVTLNLKNLASFADYFVICSGHSSRQVRSIADAIVRKLKEKNREPLGVEGYQGGEWVLVDCGDVVVHIFYQAVRDFYDLEKLWEGAKLARA